MQLGLGQVVKDGNGNALLYTALIAAIAANSLPTPFDGIYFRRVNSLHRRYDKKEITAEKLEWSIAGEYYLWTSLWYGALFGGIYAFGGEYKTNSKILLALIAGGLVVGSVQKNIDINKKIEKEKANGQ